MTTEYVVPEVLHVWAISLRASEEARRRGDRRTGTDHLLLALLEDPSIEVVLGVSLQRARQGLESLDHEALGALGIGSRSDAPPLPMPRRAEEAEDQRRCAKGSPPHDPRGKESARGRVEAQPSEAPDHGAAGAGPDSRSPTPRSRSGTAAKSGREHVRGSAPIGCDLARQLSPQ